MEKEVFIGVHIFKNGKLRPGKFMMWSEIFYLFGNRYVVIPVNLIEDRKKELKKNYIYNNRDKNKEENTTRD
jgi:hypothetical protein